MPSTFFGLNIGSTGLYAYKTALNVTAHNISNAEKEGYSRQVLDYKASRALKVSSSYGMVGTGINVGGVSQIRNEYYDTKYWRNATVRGEYTAKADYMKQIEAYFNEVKMEGFTTTFNSMFDSIHDLAKDPSNLTTRTQLTNFALSFTEYFNFLSNSMNSIQEQCNFEVQNQVEKINSLSTQIAHLNKQINTIESNGFKANDLRDERAMLVDELSEIADVSVKENIVGSGIGINNYIVKINNQMLVDGVDYNTLKLIPRQEKSNQNDIDGLFDIEWDNGNEFNPISTINNGTLKALFEVRDGNDRGNLQGRVTASTGDTQITMVETNINSAASLNIPERGFVTIGNAQYKYNGFTATKDGDNLRYTFNLEPGEEVKADLDNRQSEIGQSINYKGIPYYMGQLNQFIRTFASKFNDIHKSGKDLNGDDGMDFFNGLDKVKGINYQLGDIESDINAEAGEEKTSYYFITAANLTLTKEIIENPRLVVTTADIANGIEANDITSELLKLRADKGMFKQGDPASFLQTLVAEVGIDARKADNFAKGQDNILRSISNQRLSVSGVDVDEETINLVRFQNAYNLSAKVISIMDEIYDKLINYMGV